MLVIEQDPTEDLRRVGEWLLGAGLRPGTTRPYAGDPLPPDLSGYAALVVTGGGPDGTEAPWHAEVESLLRKGVRHRVPTLALGTGAYLLAAAHGGRAAEAGAGPVYGPGLVARRDVADHDPLFREVPFTPDVVQWRHWELAELPHQAVLLAASPRYPHEAFRVGPAAWGMQFQIGPDAAQVAAWADRDDARLRAQGLDPGDVRAAAEAVLDDLAEVWQPFIARFAALARGELAPATPDLPVLGR